MWSIIALGAIVIFAFLVYLSATMVQTITWVITETGEGGGMGSAVSVTSTGDGVISVTADTGPANKEIDIGWDADTIQSLVIVSTIDCTLYTNAPSGGAPADTMALKANIPLNWIRNSGIPFPFVGGAGGVVTKIYVTNAAAAVGVFKLRGLSDVTP